MKYIHVPGCECASTLGYPTRREEAIASYVAAHDGLPPGLVADNTPDGSCITWLDDAYRGTGWPASHTREEARADRLIAHAARVIACASSRVRNAESARLRDIVDAIADAAERHGARQGRWSSRTGRLPLRDQRRARP